MRTTWEKVIPISDVAARLFHGKLFELDPGVRPLFTSDMEEQGRKLMQMITVAVQGLDNLDQTLPAVRGLGRRRADYGVKDEHYDTAGAALLWTLGQGLGDGFRTEVQESWATTYGMLASVMKDAARA